MGETPDNPINQRLRELLFLFKKNGSELAKDLGVTQSTVVRTLKGETLPSSKFLIPLGEKLGVSIDWLLFGKGEMLENEKKSKKSKEGDSEKVKLLEQQIKLLKQTIGDKDEIIKLLKEK